MKKTVLVAGFALAALSGAAQDSTASARAAYQQQQALAEVPRLVQQFDLLVQNQDAIVARLVKLEGTDTTGDVRAEIAALRAEVADLKASIRREQDAMRAEIVKDLAGRIARMTPPPAPQPAPPPRGGGAGCGAGGGVMRAIRPARSLTISARIASCSRRMEAFRSATSARRAAISARTSPVVSVPSSLTRRATIASWFCTSRSNCWTRRGTSASACCCW